MTNLIKLSNQQVEHIANQVMNEEVYQKTEPLLHELLRKFPKNKEPEEIAAKVILLDKLYSTQIFNYKKTVFLSEIVENIRSISDFDERVKNGDAKIISEIYRGFDRSLFSFATKYCCLHNTVLYNRDDYSIYDSTVHKFLPKYAKSLGLKLTGTQIDEWRKSGNYKAFNDTITTVLDKAEITLIGRKRMFDLFLWAQR